MREAVDLEVTEKAEAARKAKRRVFVSGILKILGVSRSGYHAWLKHVPSNAEKRRETVKAKIKDIYDESNEYSGAYSIMCPEFGNQDSGKWKSVVLCSHIRSD